MSQWEESGIEAWNRNRWGLSTGFYEPKETELWSALVHNSEQESPLKAESGWNRSGRGEVASCVTDVRQYVSLRGGKVEEAPPLALSHSLTQFYKILFVRLLSAQHRLLSGPLGNRGVRTTSHDRRTKLPSTSLPPTRETLLVLNIPYRLFLKGRSPRIFNLRTRINRDRKMMKDSHFDGF